MKTSRFPTTPPRTAESFGLFAVIKSKRVILPLKGVECDFSVVSGMAEVSMTQIFRQDNEKPLDCEYLFPLPADASVYCCEADINGRTIRAEVRERQQARELAAQKKAAGFRTALVEAERENLFTLSLGNVQPGDFVLVQLKYFQTLRALAGMASLEIPFCPGIRYIPGAPLIRSNQGKGIVDDTDEVPDASRITPVRIDAEHPDAAYIEVRGTLDGKFVNENDLASPSHQIDIRRTGEQVRISLSDKGEVPDRDFVLRWKETNTDAVASRAWVRQQDDATYALFEIRAPKEAPAERAPVDFYFLVDRSGSMAGDKWNKAAEALLSCMKVLGPNDRAMVTFFESHFRDFAEQPLSAEQLLRDRQFESVKKLGTAGGTELRPALKHLLEIAARHSAKRCKNLILITDAQIGNESAILELMKNSPDLPVHCFGIDVALNDSLLLALCRQQGGTFHSLNPNDDIEQAVTELGKTLGQPVLLDLALSDGWETADAAIPNLYAGQIHYLSARTTKPGSLGLRARNATAQPVTLEFQAKTATFEAPYLHWCRSRIRRFVAEGDSQAAVELSVKSNLLCPLTAFVAWDESEKVALATHELVQPSQQVAGAGSLLLDQSIGMIAGRSMSPADPGPVAAKRSRSLGEGLFRRFWARDAVEESAQVLKSEPFDELAMKRDLSEVCHKIGVRDWQSLIKMIFDWVAAASMREREKRLVSLTALVLEIMLLAKRLDRVEASQEDRAMDEVRERVHRLLKDFGDKVLQT